MDAMDPIGATDPTNAMKENNARTEWEAIRRNIRKSLPEIMASDRIYLSGVLERIDREKARGIRAEKLLGLYAAAGERLERSRKQRERRRTAVPRLHYPDALPITAERREIVASIRRNPVTIVTGQTGSGKSTQIPKMCLEAGRGIAGLIGHTQPRRIAAVAIAHRIAEELGETPGRSVGYKIRFEEKVGGGAFIKLMTDGILLAEIQGDPLLRVYDTIIIDEAHERSLNIDLILGLLRNLLRKRKDLRVVVTSATIDAEKFSRAFGLAPVIEVSGRMYPVEVRYAPLDPGLEEEGDFTFIDAAVNAVDRIRDESASGDILIFMPTERDIRETCERLGREKQETILPLFSRLTQSAQRQIFLPSPSRKIVVATNIAETSITIPGIRYVIDTGLARISRYIPRTRTFGLPITEISRSSADQRKGRCGRVENGVCIRLYPEEDFDKRPLYTTPEILRANLAAVILRMLSLGISAIESFPFIDPPDARSIRDGFDLLHELGAIRRREKEPAWALTDRGRIMARLPIDPRISRMLLEASAEGCLENVLIIAAALSIMDPREWPPDKTDEAKRAHEPFKDPSSDFLTLLNIWNRYHGALEALRSQSRMRKFCKEHFLSYNRMREWIEVHDQIRDILDEAGISANGPAEDDYYEQREGIHRSILSGSLSNIAVKKEKNIYQAAKGRQVMIFPGSGLFNRGGTWVMSAEMVETTRIYARTAANIDSAWIEPLAEGLCRYSYSDPRWDRGRGEVVAREQVSLYGLIIVPGRKVSYGRIDPGHASSLFIRSALVEADVAKAPAFLEHNRKLIEEVSQMEEKLRRRDLLVSEDDLAEFYRRRLDPASSGDIFDLRTLSRRIREEGGDAFLRMKPDDIMRYTPGEENLREYPEHFHAGRLRLPLQYSFQPGKPEDGVTLKIPLPALPSVSVDAADWLVPGLLREKVTCLIRGLPKNYRKALIPVPDTVETILHEMPRNNGPLTTALGEFIREKFRISIPASAWNPAGLPEHLRMRYSVTAGNRELRAGRNLADLQKGASDSAESEFFEKARKEWERRGVSFRDFEDLPDSILLGTEEDPHGFAFPALVESGDGVDIRLFRRRQEAEEAHRKGVIALFAARFRKELMHLKKNAALPPGMKQWAIYFGGEKELERCLYERMLGELFDVPLRSRSEFERHAQAAAPKILPCGQEVLNEVRPVLKSYHEARVRLRSLADANRSLRAASSFLADIRGEMERLVPRDFPLRYARERLPRLAVYISALLERAERGLLHIEKDRIKNSAVRAFEERCEAMANSVDPASSPDKIKAIEEFRWMLQEYRISVFAPKVRTLFPVSPKRLEQKLEEIASLK